MEQDVSVIALLAALFVAAQTTNQSAADCAPVRVWAPPEQVCELADPRLDEISGMVASRRHPDAYYVHNDSGGEPEVYVVNRKCELRAVIRLPGAKNVDWEDIALAPGRKPGTHELCIADIGDNQERRDDLVLYRLSEPDLPAQAGGRVDAEFQTYRIRYADGPQNAEAFFVTPRGDGYVLTKRTDRTSCVYQLSAPWRAGAEVNTLARVATIEFPGAAAAPATVVTGADLSPDGGWLAVRCYLDGWEWRVSSANVAVALKAAPARIALAAEPQGEAIAYAADGRALLTISEHKAQPLYEMRLASEP